MSSPFFETPFSRKIKTYMLNGIDVNIDKGNSGFNLPDQAEAQLPENPVLPGQGGGGGSSTVYNPDNWDGLINYYPFDEGFDDSVNDLNLTAPDTSPTQVTGLNGTNGYSFNGSSDYLEASFSNNQLTDQGKVSISVWVDMNTLGNPQFLIFDADTGSPVLGLNYNNGQEIFANLDTNGQTSASTSQSTGDTNVEVVNPVNISTGRLIHLAGSWDGSNLSLYVNGQRAVRKTLSNDSLSIPSGTNYKVMLGGFASSGQFADLNILDEAMIFNTGLTHKQVHDLYRKRFGEAQLSSTSFYDSSTYNDVQYHYGFEETTGPEIKNHGSKDNNLYKITGTPDLNVDVASDSSGVLMKDNIADSLGNLNVKGNYPRDQIVVASWFTVQKLHSDSNNDILFGLLNRNSPTDFSNVGIMVQLSQNGELVALMGFDDGNVGTISSTTGAVSAGTWHHFAVAYDGDQMELFLDGSSVGTSSNMTSGALITDVDTLYIGSNPNKESKAYDELMISGDPALDIQSIVNNPPNFNSADSIFPLISNLSLDSTSNVTETSVDAQATVDVAGTEVSSSDTTELVYKAVNSGSVVSSTRYEFDQANTPVTNTATISGLSSGTSYEIEVDLEINSQVKSTSSTLTINTPSGTLYNPSDLETNYNADFYYPMNETYEGSTAPTFSSEVDDTMPPLEANNYMLQDGVDSSTINADNAIEFNNNAKIETTQSLPTLIRESFEWSFGFWMNITTTQTRPRTILRIFYPETGNNAVQVLLPEGTEAGIQLQVYDDNDNLHSVTSPTGAITTGSWQHWYFEYQAGTGVRIVKDGSSIAETSMSVENATRTNSNMKMQLGTDTDTNYLNSVYFDEFVEFGQALTETTIQNLLIDPTV